ncbi:hypothetical protein PS1_033236 [Malus domestica]
MTSKRIEPNNQGDDRLRVSILLGARRSALYHGEPQYYYDVPTQTEECEYDGDGEQKSDIENSLYEESDNDGDIGDFDTDNSSYDEDNDAMLEDENFNDNTDTPESFIGCRVVIKGAICPKIQGKLEKNKTLSRIFRPVYCGNGVFQVEDSLVDQHSVNLWTKTCSCKRWELNGIPCMHAISAIFHNPQQTEEFVDQCYTPYAYLRAYSPIIYPVKGMKYWPKVNQTPVLPPMVKKQPWRTKK